MESNTSDNPWDWMQPHDIARFGAVIGDEVEQARWCRAVMLGGLPYMWRKKAAVVREMMYDRMALREDDRVLILGESIESCGFVEDIRARIGAGGHIDVIDFTDEARDAYIAGRRGRHGQLATWRYDYTREMEAESYDVVAVLQGVQHTEDWAETGRELLRVMKPGRTIMLAEITFSPQMVMKSELDLHIEYWMDKLFSRIGWPIAAFPYYSPAELARAFAGLVTDPETFSWKGVEFFWGSKA
jgi:hypothetical protein